MKYISVLVMICFAVILNATDIQQSIAAKKIPLTTQIYPNPFKDYAQINFQIMIPGKVEINIYNAVGSPIKNLLSKNLSDGIYQVIWDGTNQNNQQAQNGIYFYRISHNGTNYTGKILKTD